MVESHIKQCLEETPRILLSIKTQVGKINNCFTLKTRILNDLNIFLSYSFYRRHLSVSVNLW